MSEPRIITTVSRCTDTARAIEEVCDRLFDRDARLTIIFFSPQHDVGRLMHHLSSWRQPGVVTGCSTAGEISDEGFLSGAVVGMSLSGPGVVASAVGLSDIEMLTLSDIDKVVDQLNSDFSDLAGDTTPSFLLTLMDGVSRGEDLLTSYLYHNLSYLPIVGGSAGDDLCFERTHVFENQKLLNQGAVLVLVHYSGPHVLVKHHHFKPTSHEVQFTRVSDNGRRVRQINGRPARSYYAELLGVEPESIQVDMASETPFGFEMLGRTYIHSIIGASEDGSLQFASSVDPSMKYRLMKAGNLPRKTASYLRAVVRQVGSVRGFLAFHCAGRYLEAKRKGQLDELFDSTNIGPLAGLHTYGEQFYGFHVNHTLTGIVFG